MLIFTQCKPYPPLKFSVLSMFAVEPIVTNTTSTPIAVHPAPLLLHKHLKLTPHIHQ